MNIVEAALADWHEMHGDQDTEWTVSFVNNDSHRGDLESLGDDCYALKSLDRRNPYYFSATKVAYLFAHT